MAVTKVVMPKLSEAMETGRIIKWLKNEGDRVSGGEIVAEITPPGQGATDVTVPAGLLALARRGLATLGGPGDAAVYPSLPRSRKRKRTAAQLLDEERGLR